jgi:hypothetical protein
MSSPAIAAVIAVSLSAPCAVAEDSAPRPVRKAAMIPPADTRPKMLESFEEFGKELGEAGRAIGTAIVETAKSGAARIERDVKAKKFRPGPSPESAPRHPERGGTP